MIKNTVKSTVSGVVFFGVVFCRDPAVASREKKVLQYNKYRDIILMTVDIDTVATPHVCGKIAVYRVP